MKIISSHASNPGDETQPCVHSGAASRNGRDELRARYQDRSAGSPLRGPERGELAGEDLDDIRAAMRAASLSVRSYLWRTGDNDPADRK
ncbi:hypothetical protein [Streptomyces sp. NBC_00878]|uniref:hypothetical protein n=1 Tax=Streptomyces sp. NBC_00878 TaxID=2975854 RepID=UPI0022502ECB|nr:hypothetical protein [Streptomyces sp. NBC_00878]MCX4903475.1 hypothetical protein [Streptomyces sp. NBC_00878]